METFEQHREAARDAARQLRRLWLPSKHARLLQEPPPAKFNTPLISKLMQQSRQHAEAIAAALRFSLKQLTEQQQDPEQQQQLEQQRQSPTEQQQQQQGLMLLKDLLGGALAPSSAASFIMQLLLWLQSKPDLPADLGRWSNLGTGAEVASGQRYCLQEMWLAGMQVWQLLSLLVAEVAQAGLEWCCEVVQMCEGELSYSSVKLLIGQLWFPTPMLIHGNTPQVRALFLPVIAQLECLAAMYAAAGFGPHPGPLMLPQRKNITPEITGIAALVAEQLQHCAELLPTLDESAADAAAAAAGAALAQTGSSNGALLPVPGDGLIPLLDQSVRLALAVVRMQQCMMRVVGVADEKSQSALKQLAAGNSSAQAGLQLLCAYAHVLYEQHLENQKLHQQDHQQQQQHSGGQHVHAGQFLATSSSSRGPVQFRQLPITPVHQRLKHLPEAGRQLYLQAVRALLQQQQGQGVPVIAAVCEAAQGLLSHLKVVVSELKLQQMKAEQAAAAAAGSPAAAARVPALDPPSSTRANSNDAAPAAEPEKAQSTCVTLQTKLESNSPAVAAPAVLLVIEVLQLLAALLEHQHEQQQETVVALDHCQSLLHQQLGMLSACPSAGYSIRRSVVLRQSGQQLLQLLRWQVQQAVLEHQQPRSSGNSSSSSSDTRSAGDVDIARLTPLCSALGDVLGRVMWAAGACDQYTDQYTNTDEHGDAAGLLPSLAAAYPVDYFSLIDCAMQSGLAGPHCMTCITLLAAGLEAFAQQPAALLQQPQVVLALASALASTVKLFSCVYLQGAAVLGQDDMVEINRQVLAVVPHLVLDVLYPLAAALRVPAPSTAASSSSSSTADRAEAGRQAVQQQQQTQQNPSVVLLTVLLARSLCVLADATEAAADQAGLSVDHCLAKAVLSQAEFVKIGAHGDVMYGPIRCDALSYAGEDGDEEKQCDSSAAALCWQRWQGCVVNTANIVAMDLGVVLSEDTAAASAPSSAAAEDTPAAAVVPEAAAAACCDIRSDIGSRGSGSIAGRVRWAYLLQLGRSRKLVDACSDYSKYLLPPTMPSVDGSASFSAVLLKAINLADIDASTPAAVQSRQQPMDEMYRAALQFCRVLAGAAPLPHLCNNLGCSSLAAGGTEAAAAVKLCSGCGAWYCSAGCAAAHWRQHKKACRRMAALGLNVNA